jgi:23S rRNA pseudouridine1911/1915/1917 synthase
MNRGAVYRGRVDRRADGLCLPDYLAFTHAHSSREAWLARILAGQVDLGSRPASTDDVVRTGDVVTWRRPPWNEPDAPRDCAVVFEDEWVVAVSKPSGLPTLPAAGFQEHTLLAIARERWPGASPLHRLGRHTSGLVLLARTPAAASALSREWRERRVVKHYLGLATGTPPWGRRQIDVPIGPVPHDRLGSIHAATNAGKPARSVARVVERRGGATLLEVEILTGRPHQVRIHLAAAGHPLVGDPLYGDGGLPVTSALPGEGGYLLHAVRLAFAHPASGEWIELTAPPPDVLRPRR